MVNGSMQRRRTSRAVENDERILDAAIGLIDRHGVDHLSLRDVAEAVELTHGALYSRYDNVAELLVDLWQRRLMTEIEQLVESAVARGETLPNPDESIWLTEPTAQRRAAVVLCLVAERVDELAEVIPRDLEMLLATRGVYQRDVSADAVSLGHLCALIGYCVESRVHGFVPADVMTVVGWLHGGSDPPFDGPALPSREPQQIDFATGDAARDAVLRACSAVVARSGMHRATLKRIGRAAGCVPSTIYSWYGSREELMYDMVRRGVEMTTVPPGDESFGRVEIGPALTAGWAEPSARVRRRIPLEMYLAAMNNTRLAGVIEEVLRRHLAVVAAGLAPAVPELQMAAITLLRHGNRIASGISVLADLVPGLDRVDWRPYSSAILRGALRSATSAVQQQGQQQQQ